jgi:hypothetical protein
MALCAALLCTFSSSITSIVVSFSYMFFVVAVTVSSLVHTLCFYVFLQCVRSGACGRFCPGSRPAGTGTTLSLLSRAPLRYFPSAFPRALPPSLGSVFSIQSHQSGWCAWPCISSKNVARRGGVRDTIDPTVGHSYYLNRFWAITWGILPSTGTSEGMTIMESRHATSATGIPVLSAPPPQTVNVCFSLSPADVNLNMIERVYPSKPEALSFPGLQRRLSCGRK